VATSREAAVAYLDVTLGPTRGLAGVAEGDWDVVVDRALTALGYDRSAAATVAAADVHGYELLLDYFALSFLHRRLISLVDISLDGPQMSKSRSQAVKQTKEAMEAARVEAMPYLAAVTRSGYGAMVTLVGDYLEVYP